MAVWVVRGGRFGEREEEALENCRLTIGFGIRENIESILDWDGLRNVVQEANPDATSNQIGNYTGQIWAFKNRIVSGDLVVMPRKGQPVIAIGEIRGEYVYRPEGSEFTHGREVHWINQEVPRSLLSQDLKNSIGSISTVFQPGAPDAESRLRHIAETGIPLAIHPREDAIIEEPDDEGISESNIAEMAGDQIRDYVGRNFRGHEFTRLVAEVLKSQGFGVEVAPPGPDGGVDIVAGSGPLAFDPPRICVQVKSGAQVVDVHVLRQLSGVLKHFGADYGLLVSWGGFNGAAKREARESTYFNMRLWDSETFLDLLYHSYDKLPSALKAELPLKQVWVLDEPTA